LAVRDLLDSVGLRIEVLDLRYSVEMTDFLLAYAIDAINPFTLRRFYGSCTGSNAFIQAFEKQAVRHVIWAQFCRRFHSAEVLYLDNFVSEDRDDVLVVSDPKWYKLRTQNSDLARTCTQRVSTLNRSEPFTKELSLRFEGKENVGRKEASQSVLEGCGGEVCLDTSGKLCACDCG
jgi:hypothetical protein